MILLWLLRNSQVETTMTTLQTWYTVRQNSRDQGSQWDFLSFFSISDTDAAWAWWEQTGQCLAAGLMAITPLPPSPSWSGSHPRLGRDWAQIRATAIILGAPEPCWAMTDTATAPEVPLEVSAIPALRSPQNDKGCQSDGLSFGSLAACHHDSS